MESLAPFNTYTMQLLPQRHREHRRNVAGGGGTVSTRGPGHQLREHEGENLFIADLHANWHKYMEISMEASYGC